LALFSTRFPFARTRNGMTNAHSPAARRPSHMRIALAVALAGTVAACSSSRFAGTQESQQPEQLNPVRSSTVQTSQLPPPSGQQQGQIQGQSMQGQTMQGQTAIPGQTGGQGTLRTPDGQPVNMATNGSGQSQQSINSRIGPGGQSAGGSFNSQTFTNDMVSQDPMLSADANGQSSAQLSGGQGSGGQSMSANGSMIASAQTGQPTPQSSRDLSGGLTTEKLLGSWTVIAGGDQCQVNLTQTSAPGSDRFRASAPNCTIDPLGGVASWRLAGSQVQLYSEGGELIGALLQSGNRFIGTLSGGRGISMAG